MHSMCVPIDLFFSPNRIKARIDSKGAGKNVLSFGSFAIDNGASNDSSYVKIRKECVSLLHFPLLWYESFLAYYVVGCKCVQYSILKTHCSFDCYNLTL